MSAPASPGISAKVSDGLSGRASALMASASTVAGISVRASRTPASEASWVPPSWVALSMSAAASRPLPSASVPLSRPSAKPSTVPSRPPSPMPRSELSKHLPPIQLPAPPRHGMPLGWKMSPGQDPDMPVQLSVTSQTPAAARQVTVLGWNESPGQVFMVPSQFSAISHVS